jgi:hypothetical protein
MRVFNIFQNRHSGIQKASFAGQLLPGNIIVSIRKTSASANLFEGLSHHGKRDSESHFFVIRDCYDIPSGAESMAGHLYFPRFRIHGLETQLPAGYRIDAYIQVA